MLYFKHILLSAVHIPGLDNNKLDLTLSYFNDRNEFHPAVFALLTHFC